MIIGPLPAPFYSFAKESHRLLGRTGLLLNPDCRRLYEFIMGLPEDAPLAENAQLAIRTKDGYCEAR